MNCHTVWNDQKTVSTADTQGRAQPIRRAGENTHKKALFSEKHST